MNEELKAIIESLIFVSEAPISVDQLMKLLPEFEPEAIRKAVSGLKEDYEMSGHGFTLKEVAGGLQFRTRSEHQKWIARIKQPAQQKISRAALETLAIIAYKQPIIRSEIEQIRGGDSGGVLRFLLEKNLIRILGRKEIPGKPIIYATTRFFLELFGLKTLKDLPTPREVEVSEPANGNEKAPANEEHRFQMADETTKEDKEEDEGGTSIVDF